MPIILQVNNGCSNDENDMENDSINIYDEYTHSEIINRCDFWPDPSDTGKIVVKQLPNTAPGNK
jgi:hypothetical protein